MTPDTQKEAFQLAQARANSRNVLGTSAGQDLATIGERLYCYVPRRLRHLNVEQLLTISLTEIESLYGSGSWAIDDLIRLLKRIADDAGSEAIAATPEVPSITRDVDLGVRSGARWFRLLETPR